MRLPLWQNRISTITAEFSNIIIADFLTPEILADSYKFSRSGIYKTISTDSQKGYLEYIDSLPMMPEPEVFGMHENAAITCAINEVSK